MAPASSPCAFPLHCDARLLDEHDRVLPQHSHTAGTYPKRPTFQERPEGFSGSISEEIQRESDAVHLDQGAGTLPAHHRSHKGVPSSPPEAAKTTEEQS